MLYKSRLDFIEDVSNTATGALQKYMTKVLTKSVYRERDLVSLSEDGWNIFMTTLL